MNSETVSRTIRIEYASGRGVAARWRSQYSENGAWRDVFVGGKSATVYERLCALGDNPPIDKVAEVIGNKSWSYLLCLQCNEHVDRAFVLGDYEHGYFCFGCVEEFHQAVLAKSGDQA